MTLSTLLGKDHSTTHSVINEREHISFHPPWKGSSSHAKNPQSALSALTLLAFLFFLNMLQSCLRDSLQSQAPITIMMMTTTTTTETEGQKRHKRSNNETVPNLNRVKEISDIYLESTQIGNNKVDKIKEQSTAKGAVPVYMDNNEDYKIFVMDQSTSIRNLPRNQKNNYLITILSDLKTKEPKHYPFISSRACCKCDLSLEKTNYQGNVRTETSSDMCDFIGAIHMQNKCKRFKCTANNDNVKRRAHGEKLSKRNF